MVNGADHMAIRTAGRPRSCPLSPNPSPPNSCCAAKRCFAEQGPPIPARLESNVLSFKGHDGAHFETAWDVLHDKLLKGKQ